MAEQSSRSLSFLGTHLARALKIVPRFLCQTLKGKWFQDPLGWLLSTLFSK